MNITGTGATGFFYPQRAMINYGHERNVYAMLWAIPQFNIPAFGITITLTDGFRSFTLTDCAVDKGSLRIGEDGHILQVGMWGSVWRWNGEISGVYNVRNPDGSVITATKKTCRELAVLLWQSMGVPVGDVSPLPGDETVLPEINWQCADSYSELSDLCRKNGCVPQLNAANNFGEVVRLGNGPALPNNDDLQTVDHGFSATPPPMYLKACAGPTRYQSKVKLKAQMLEPDGTMVDPDDVSYKPVAGWTGVDPEDPLGPDADPAERAAAKKSYGKYWILESQADGTQAVPGYGDVGTADRILPLLNETAEDFDSGIGTYRRGAYLKGKIAIQSDFGSLINSADDELIEVEFRLVGEKGLFITDVPLVKYDANLQFVLADVFAVCSYHVQDTTHSQYAHYSLTRVISPTGGGTKVIRLPHIERWVIAEYSGTSVTGITTNDTQVNQDMNGALTAAETQYQVVSAKVGRYRGIQNTVPLSGTIRQFRFLVDMEDGAFTWMSFNTEHAPGMPRHRQRQRIARDGYLESIREFDDHERRRRQRRGA